MKKFLRSIAGKTARYLIKNAKNVLYLLNNLQYIDQPQYRDALIGMNVELGNIKFTDRNALGDNVRIVGEVILGYATTVGSDGIMWAGSTTITIGNYCQIAPRVAIYAVNHPTSYLTTYVNRKLLNGELTKLATQKAIQIGHDVWIGHGAIILPGVTIGNGAIIGGGAVISRDVKPYEVVVGNPAKPIKLRFDPKVVELLEKLQWWIQPIEKQEAYRKLFFTNLNYDVDASIQLIKSYLES